MDKVKEYKNAIKRCCGDKVGKQFCDTYGCGCIVELLVEIERRDKRIAALEDENKALRKAGKDLADAADYYLLEEPSTTVSRMLESQTNLWTHIGYLRALLKREN